jgi:hypothetical protein
MKTNSDAETHISTDASTVHSHDSETGYLQLTEKSPPQKINRWTEHKALPLQVLVTHKFLWSYDTSSSGLYN